MYRILSICAILAIFIGCGSSTAPLDTPSPQTSVTSLRLLGGETEIVTVSLQGSTPQATTAQLSVNNSQNYAIGVSLSAKTVSFTLDNPQLGSVSPSSCTLSSDNPTCDITIKTIDNWSSNTSKDPVVQKGNIIATVSDTPNQLISVTTYSEAPQRRIYFQNQCPYDVWLGSAGSNVSVIGCSPNGTIQANCPSANVCYTQTGTSNSYCIPGTATVANPTQSQVTPSCANRDTNTSSSTWGTCYCTQNSDCGVNLCQPINATSKQCFNNINVNAIQNSAGSNGFLPKNSPSVNMPYVKYAVDTTKASGILFGGKIYFKTGCDANGLNCAVADLSSATSSNTPQTLSEFTLQNKPSDTDYYDVSYINGINVPIQFTPYYKSGVQLAVSPTASNGKAYWCTMAGGTTASMSNGFAEYNKTINAPKSGLTDINLSNALVPFACGYDFNKTSVLLPLVPSGGVACSSSVPCTVSGQTCGLSLSNAEGNAAANVTTTCGAVEGYWTYAQLCAANNSFVNATYGVDCTKPNNLAYSLCKAETGADAGSVRSCYNSNTTTSGQTCCGYSNWTLNGTNLIPTMTPVSDVNRTYWTGNIQPVVKPVKMACPTAYSYQFDDPYSTFNCAGTTTNSNGINVAHYKVTLCPSGSQTPTGFSPTYVPCVPTTLPGTPATEFVVGYINTQTTVASIFNSDTNTLITQLPDGYYSLTGNLNFGITATGSSGSSTCYYTAANANSCISLNASQPNSPSCASWIIATGSTWNGRSITVPSQGSQCMPQTPSGIALNEFVVGLANTITTSVSVSNSDTNTTIPLLADGNYNLTGNLDLNITATGGDGNSTTCMFKAASATSCIALDVSNKFTNANCSKWPISSGAPWTGRSITVPTQGNTPLGCVPSTPTGISSDYFAVGMPTGYTSPSVTYSNPPPASVSVPTSPTGYYDSTTLPNNTTVTLSVTQTNAPKTSFTCNYSLATPTSCLVLLPSSTTGCPAPAASGVWQGRNISFSSY